MPEWTCVFCVADELVRAGGAAPKLVGPGAVCDAHGPCMGLRAHTRMPGYWQMDHERPYYPKPIYPCRPETPKGSGLKVSAPARERRALAQIDMPLE